MSSSFLKQYINQADELGVIAHIEKIRKIRNTNVSISTTYRIRFEIFKRDLTDKEISLVLSREDILSFKDFFSRINNLNGNNVSPFYLDLVKDRTLLECDNNIEETDCGIKLQIVRELRTSIIDIRFK